MLAGENKPFLPLTSASPRLLFDFLPALMSSKDGEKTHAERRRAKNIWPDALVFNPIDQRHALGAVDDLGGEFDELLWVALEVVEPATVHQDAIDAAAGQLGFVVKIDQRTMRTRYLTSPAYVD